MQIIVQERVISYINKPYRFKSEDEFWVYIEKAKQETLDSLYKKTEVIWKKYVDANSFHISICSADTIFTHKQDRFGTTHYLFSIGEQARLASNLQKYHSFNSTLLTSNGIFKVTT